MVERWTGRARVTMEWELDAEFETTEGGRVRCVGWLADATALLEECRAREANKVTITRLDGAGAGDGER